MMPDVRRAHFSIGGDAIVRKTLPLNGTGSFHPGANNLRRFTQALIRELFIFDPRHINVNINPVHEWTRYPLLILGDRRVGAGAGFYRVAVVAARAGIHGSNQLKIGREGHRTGSPADGHDFVLDGLAQYFQYTLSKLGEFIQEQYAAVRQRDFARMRVVATTRQPGVADGG